MDLKNNHTPQISRNRALVFAVLSTCFSSIAIIYHGLAAKALPLTQAIATSHLLGAFILFCVIEFRSEKVDWKNLIQFRFDFVMALLCRFVVGGYILWCAMKLTIGVKAMFFTKAEPYFVLMWLWFFDRVTVSRGHLFLLLIHFSGAVLLSRGGFGTFDPTQWGDMLVLLAVSIMALSYRYSARLSSNIPTLHLTMSMQLVSGLIFLPFAFLEGPWAGFIANSHGWFDVFMTVILWNLMGLPFWFVALKGLEGWLVSALRALGPLLAAPIAIIFFDQSLNGVQIIGATIVLGTSFLLARERR